jgi:hypothetical protein
MKLTQLILVGIGSAAFLAITPAKAQIITQWTFNNDSAANNNSPATSTGTGTADAIGFTNSLNGTTSTNTDDVVLGATADTGTNTEADLTNTWRVRGKSPGNGYSSQAAIATQGAQFFAPTTGTTTGAIKVSFDWYVTSAAPSNLELLYTTNGGTNWTNLTINTGSNTNISSLTGSASDANTVNGAYVNVTANSSMDWFQGLTATITDPSALNDAGFGIELVNASTGADVLAASGGAYNNSSGNWRFDNITISSVATPEPSSWVLALGAGATFLALLFRRKNACA